MNFFEKYIGNLYLTKRLYVVVGIGIVLCIIAFFLPVIFASVKIVLWLILILFFIDFLFLFIISKPPSARRLTAERFSNGDENKVELQVKSNMGFATDVEIIDEIPVQFQKRNFSIYRRLKPFQQENIIYTIRPVTRGEYSFGRIIIYVKTL
ncbi:MAG: hypothetical protein KA319_10875 [Ferruginibacter sp.]|nr:hypothetical protein [Ferruginibacter sp.]